MTLEMPTLFAMLTDGEKFTPLLSGSEGETGFGQICDVQQNSWHCWGRLMIGFAGPVELKQLPVFRGHGR
jgi:hypothetical protein